MNINCLNVILKINEEKLEVAKMYRMCVRVCVYSTEKFIKYLK